MPRILPPPPTPIYIDTQAIGLLSHLNFTLLKRTGKNRSFPLNSQKRKMHDNPVSSPQTFKIKTFFSSDICTV